MIWIIHVQHVQINEAAIDWLNRGSNYSDVVSQAADEAGGRAFATDYAGSVDSQIADILAPYSESLLTQITNAQTLQ